MTVKVKITLTILIAILLGGAGYFFIKSASKILPPVTTTIPTEEIDTSDWQTYRNETLGFEIKMPKEWYIETSFGNWITGDWEFWQGQVGRVFSHGPARNENETWPYFELRVKDSNLTMEEFVKAAPNIDEKHPEDIIINNLLAKKYVDEALRQAYDGNVYSEITVIKNNQRYYYFDFSTAYASSTNMSERRTTWNTIISTFRPIEKGEASKELDTSYWKTYRNEKLGFEIKMPKEWVKSGEDIGPQPFLEDEFWQEQVGGARFIASMTNGFPQFNLRVKDSDLTLERFAGKVGFGKEENFLINNLPAVRYFLDGRKDKQPNYREALLLKNNNRYYYFEFSASDDNIDKDIAVWNKIILTFKSLD